MRALPLITLALCVAFLGFQQAAVTSRATHNEELESRVAKVRSGAPLRRGAADLAGAPATKSSRSASHTGTGETAPESLADIDLEELAKSMMAAENGMPDLRAMLKVQSLLLEATPEELRDLIARTGELDIPDQMKQRLLGDFVSALAEHDPQGALELAFRSEHLDLDRQRWQFSGAFGKWAEKDPRAALAWFDGEVARGSFEPRSLDGHRDWRLAFETVAVSALLDTDPGLARQRLLSMPEDERRQILSDSHRFRINSENAAAHADLVRAAVPEEQRAAVLASATQNLLRQDGYGEVVEYTDRIGATVEERAAIIEEAVGRKFERFAGQRETPTAQDVADMQSFLEAQAPEAAGQIAGQALGRFGRHGANFDAALELVRDAHRANPSDDLLVGFLNFVGIRDSNREAARELAGQITDPERRQQILDQHKQ